MAETKRHIDWSKVKEWIENNWSTTSPIVHDSEIDEMAIGVAGEIDKFIQNKLQALLDEIMKESKETLISLDDCDDTTSRIIKDADMEAIKKKYIG